MPRIPLGRRDGGRAGLGAGSGDGSRYGRRDPLDGLLPGAASDVRRLEARDARLASDVSLSEQWLSGVTALRDASDAPEGAPPGFARAFLLRADKARAEALRLAPPDRRSELDRKLLGLRSELAEGAVAVEAEGRALRRRLGLYRALEGYREGVTRDPGLFGSASRHMRSLVEGLGLPGSRRAGLLSAVADILGNAAVDGEMSEPSDALERLESGFYDGSLTASSKASRLSEARVLTARSSSLARERARAALFDLAARGLSEESSIVAAETAGTLTPWLSARLRRMDAAARRSSSLRRARIERVSVSDGPLDPSSSEDRAAVDAFWEEVSETAGSEDPAAQQASELSFVRRHGVLPSGLERKYRGGLLSGDPVLAVSAARAVMALEKIDWRLVWGLRASERRAARAVASYADLGLPPERAVALAEQEGEQEKERPGGGVVDNDPSDGPFSGGDEGDGHPEEEEPQLTDEEVDELLRRDGFAPIPRGGVPVEEESDPRLGPLASFVASQRNELLAARQFTSPDTSRYDRLGRYGEWAMGPAYVDQSGEVIPISPRRHAVLIDPESGVLTVYRRTEETDEGRLLSFGRLLSATLFTNPVTAGARAAQIANKAKSGVGTTLSSGVGPTGGGRSSRGGGGARRRSRTRKKSPALRRLPEGPGFKAGREFLTADEFRALPDRGRIDPQSVRTSQFSIREEFQAKRDALGKKRQPTVGELARGLRSGDKKPEKIPAIRIIELNGHVYSVDHRRLIAFRRAGIDIPYRKVKFDKLPTGLKDRVSNALNYNDNGAFILNRTLKVKE